MVVVVVVVWSVHAYNMHALLRHTKELFIWFEQKEKKINWNGILGREPNERNEMKLSLSCFGVRETEINRMEM